MSNAINIAGRMVGSGYPVYIIAELSANHGQNFEQAVRTIEEIKKAGADAVKIQTYTADTLTIPCDNEFFRIAGGTLWDGRTLHDLYREASLPWEWQPKLQVRARESGLDFFSTPFDETAVDFLETMNIPAYKIASFELIDLPLLRKVATTSKPIIASTGMATLAEIEEALATIRAADGGEVALLKCTSAYPAAPEDMNLRTIPDMHERFRVPVGLSDHTLGPAVPVAAVGLGACIVEKHFTLSRQLPGPDTAFSLEPKEFAAMVASIRETEKALGKVSYDVGPNEDKSRRFRRSIFVVEDIASGDLLSKDNIRCIRPGQGLHPRHYEEVIGMRATQNIKRGTPLSWELVSRVPARASV